MDPTNVDAETSDDLSIELDRLFQQKKKQFDDYEAFVAETAIFPAERGISYCLTKLCGEIGEVHDKVSLLVQSHDAYGDRFFDMGLTEEEVHSIILELGDVLWYTTALCRQFGVTLYDLYQLEPELDPIIEYGSEISFLMYLSRMSYHAGAIAERSGKMIRDKGGDGTDSSYLSDEAYVSTVVTHLHHLLEFIEMAAHGIHWMRLADVMEENVKKLSSRRARDVIKGDGDER